ncbi:MAG: hypothetical protein CBC55_02965 [Gammaproteobacteria bacterium TMED95]|nr:MAG: hypothetical protein CBC55_02965 [Gammaproteobacteria bacterium TMED95]
MRRLMLPAAVLLALTLGKMGVAHADSCAETTIDYMQCDFSIPAMSDGEVKAITNTNTDNFNGAVAASCQGGSLVIGAQECQVAEPTDCAINAGSWFSKGTSVSCHHDFQNIPLTDGEERTISSISGTGKISYACGSGKLSVKDSYCNTVKVHQTSIVDLSDNVSNLAANTRSETVYVEAFFTMDTEYTDTNSAQVQIEAELTCGNVAGSVISSNAYDVSYEGYTSGPATYNYSVQCPFTRQDLECDEFLLSDTVNGTYMPNSGDIVIPPTQTDLVNACASQGGTGVEETIFLEKYDDALGFREDQYQTVLKCMGRQSSCSTGATSNPLPVLGSAIDCDTANVSTGTGGYIAIEAGQSVSTSQVQTLLCEPLGFDNVSEIVNTSQTLPANGDVEYHAVSAICTTYQLADSAPLTSACSTEDNVSVDSDVEILTCDTARVSGHVRSSVYASQGEAIIQSRLCGRNDYTELDSWSMSGGSARVGVEADGILNIDAYCSNYIGEEEIPGCGNNQCIGEEVGPDSLYSTIEVDGKYYRDMCAEETVLSCENCEAGNFTFTDSVTGNTCTVSVSETYSGQEAHFDFFDNSVNGSVDMLCNDGAKSLVAGGDSTCYKTCSGNVTVGWEDSNGSKSCANTIPAGSYTHNEVVSLGSSFNNTGSATFRCDGYTGNWVKQSGSCLLDCNTTANWGSGISNSGQDKTNMCQANPGRVPHQSTGSMSSTSSGTSGSANYSCNNGALSLSNESCNLDCDASEVNWGAYCGGNASSIDHTMTTIVNHTKRTSYKYDSSISGAVNLRCNDGSLTESSSTCDYIASTTEGAWTTWQEKSRQCTTTPDSDDYQPDETLVQTTTCDVDYTRTRALYYVWSDGSRTQYDTETGEKTEQETSQKTVNGTGEYKRDFLGTEWGEWGTWIEYNKICYTETCTVYYERYRYVYNLYDMAPKRVKTSKSERDTKTEEVAAPREKTGQGWGDWTNWELVGSPSCNTSAGTETCTENYSRYRCREHYYNLAPRTVKDCGEKDTDTKTETTVKQVSVPIEKRWMLVDSGCRLDVSPSDSTLSRTSAFIGNIGPSCSVVGDTAGITYFHPYDIKGCGAMAGYNSEFECREVAVDDSSKYEWVYNNDNDVNQQEESVVCTSLESAYDGSAGFDVVGDIISPFDYQSNAKSAGTCDSLGAEGRFHLSLDQTCQYEREFNAGKDGIQIIEEIGNKFYKTVCSIRSQGENSVENPTEPENTGDRLTVDISEGDINNSVRITPRIDGTRYIGWGSVCENCTWSAEITGDQSVFGQKFDYYYDDNHLDITHTFIGGCLTTNRKLNVTITVDDNGEDYVVETGEFEIKSIDCN